MLQVAMEANVFITKLKAHGSENDFTDLKKVYDVYKCILSKLSTKEKGSFSLNVLCILCRNLEKVQKWRDSIDNKELLTLSIDCLRETRGLERPDRVKALACVYHIHKHAVRQNTPVPPELVLKISSMPFELDSKHLLSEYCKTYWNILADRMCYIEKLKLKVHIIKLLPKLTEDILKTLEIYNTVQFCSTIIMFLIKKLHFLYSDKHPKELNQIFEQIFTNLTKKQDLKAFKTLTERETLDLYVKFNDCLYVIAENVSKLHFKDSSLSTVVRVCITLLGHRPDLFHCLQTFYSNVFCSILTAHANTNYNETVLNSLIVSFETTEKLGYEKAMYATYPFLNQFLRLYIEFFVTHYTTNPAKDNCNNNHESCIKLIMFFMKKLRRCEQLVKCENCKVKSGLHDALRLSFLTKHFVNISLKDVININEVFSVYFAIVKGQYMILNELNDLGCANYSKCYRKLQTDIHNSAILLNKAQYYAASIKLFDIYLKHETKHEIDFKNISRALYNKSICELDFKLFEDALTDAFLSLVFSQEGLSTDKYMSLVMDIKAKYIKSIRGEDDDVNETEEEKLEQFQMISVLEACKLALKNDIYENLHEFLCNLNLSELLKHEFSMYATLWPSISPIAGVWKSLLDLQKGLYHQWVIAENEDIIVWTLYETVLETPLVVRSINSKIYSGIVAELLQNLENTSMPSPDLRVVHASLLFLQAEYDLTEAGEKYGWKVTEPNIDPDLFQAIRTLPQEHAAIRRAIQAVNMLTDLLTNINKVSKISCLQYSLEIAQVFVQQLVHLSRPAHALQLAHICCCISRHVDNKEAYVRNAGTILYHMDVSCEELFNVINPAERYWGTLMKNKDTLEVAVVFVCDVAIHLGRSGYVASSAKLVQLAQAKILSAYEKYPNVNLDLAVGRLMEAQTLLCKDSGPSILSSVNGTQRHYLSIPNTATKWSTRRLLALTLRSHAAASGAAALRVCARAARRRARACAGVALRAAAARTQAAVYAAVTCTHNMDDAQIKIDNRLKHILGLQPSNETQPYCNRIESTEKLPHFTPKQDVETMLEDFVFKKIQTSPSVPCVSVPGFKLPDVFGHDGKCTCYGCEIPYTSIIACQTSGLEASMYFRAKEFDIARNYFNGVLKMFSLVEEKLKQATERNKENRFEKYIIEFAERMYKNAFKTVQLEILIELSFFELANENFELTDDFIVRIYEIMQEMSDVDSYLSDEITNLMIASAQLRKNIKKPDEIGLESEFESLKLSPEKYCEPPTTPVTKPLIPPKTSTKLLVNDEEIPKKRKVIKLNLDEGSPEEKEIKKVTKKPDFKIPVPITSKPVLEVATPRPTRSKPNLLVTGPSNDAAASSSLDKTPQTKSQKNEFFTPVGSTPEQFFTPMTSLKTYSKKTLRHGIVKTLEQEFSTPKADKDNVNILPDEISNIVSKTRLKESGKKTLKRATSPGKLNKEKETNVAQTRSRRLRKPVNFSVDDDKK